MSLADIRSAFLVAAERVLDADGIGFYRLSSTHTTPPLEMSANLGARFLADYESIGRHDDPVLEHVIRRRTPTDSHSISRAEWHRSAARDVLGRSQLRHSMQAPLVNAGRVIGTVNFARSGSRPFGDRELSIAGDLSLHIGLALERAQRYEALGTRVAVLEGALERSGRAAVICGPDGEPLHISAPARELLDGSHDPQGPSDALARVLEVVAKFARTGDLTLTRSVKAPVSRRHLIVKLHRLRRTDAIVCFLFADSGGDDAVLPAVDVLSAREQEIAALVARGLTTRQMAAAAFISENTIKQHLKRIFAKLGVTSRAELVQLVWSLHRPGARRAAVRDPDASR